MNTSVTGPLRTDEPVVARPASHRPPAVHPWPLPRLVPALMHTGTVAVVLGLGKIHARYIAGYDFSGSSRFAWALAYIALLGLAAYGVGLPDLVKPGHLVLRAMAAVAVGTLAISALQLLLGSALLPRFVTVIAPAALVPGYVLCGRLARRQPVGAPVVVAVLDETEASALRADLAARTPSGALRLGGVLSPAAATSRADGIALVLLAEQADASMVVLGQDALRDEGVVDQAAALHARGLRVRTLSGFYDEALAMLPSQEASRASLLFDIGELHRATYDRLKRALDAVVGLVGLVVLAVVTPLVAAVNLVANRGPLLYRQARVGRNGVVFEICKFRTMAQGPEDPSWTAQGDARVTPFGRWLRRTHLDELPQVVNILRGDLATVGPRPEQPHYVVALCDSIAFYDVRHLVRPGLTGWAQVNRPYGSSTGDALDKLRYDLYYLRHQSLLFDLRILVRTLRDVAGGTGR